MKLKQLSLLPLICLLAACHDAALAQRVSTADVLKNGIVTEGKAHKNLDKAFQIQASQQFGSNTASVQTPAHLPKDWILPVPGKITNPFGNSYQYYQIYRGGHTGVDISAPRGTPVRAPAAGKVVRVYLKPNMRYGQFVILQHGPKLFSLYGHLQQVNIKLGQTLKQGQILGTVGVTGAAGYPHLHIEALEQLPRHDGAWGYLYICQAKSQQATFINNPAHVISAIQRQTGKNCQSKPLRETLTYLNPEVLWNPKQVPQYQVMQPENEELKYRHAFTLPEKAPVLPGALARPTSVPVPAVFNQSATVPRITTPDVAMAPGEKH